MPGHPPAELAAPLIAAITAPYGGLGVGPLLAAMHATDAITGLERLAGRDERIVISGSDDDLVWQDEMLRDEMRPPSRISARHDSHDVSCRTCRS